MKTLYCALLVFALAFEASSQCNPSVPSNAQVMNFTQTIGFGGAQLWICPGDTITSGGGSHTVYLEVSAMFQGGGGSNTIYCPAGAKVNMSSGSNIIYYVNIADIINAGGGPTLIQCTSISYNYASAPVPGCQQTTGLNETEDHQFSVYPNPSNGNFTIETNQPAENVSISIHDVFGRNIFKTSGEFGLKNELSIPDLEAGVYFLILNNLSGNRQTIKLEIVH